MEFFPIEITRKYRWKLAVFAIIVNYLSYLDIAQYRTTDDLMTQRFLIISLYFEEIFPVRINKYVYEILSKLPCIGIITIYNTLTVKNHGSVKLKKPTDSQEQ